MKDERVPKEPAKPTQVHTRRGRLGADGLVAGAPGARDVTIAMTPGTERQRVEEQGPFLAPDLPPLPAGRPVR